MVSSHSLCTVVALTAALVVISSACCAEQPDRYPLPVAAIQPENGHCYIASMDFGEEGDKFTGNESGLLLFEDGKPLGPGKSVHQDIRDKGEGRYSHWTREGLYFSTSDNSDPRKNGRKYEVASTNPKSALGGLARFPATPKRSVVEITTSKHDYSIYMGGTLDSDNTKTLAGSNCYITFQNNVALTIENVGDTPVVNPRLVVNDRGNWYTFDSLLEEFTRGANTDQEKVYFIWENMRQNTYHETPLYGNSVPHDPVTLFNFFGFNLCDDAGNVGCSLFHHLGLVGSKNRALHGHVQCEAFLNGKHQFMDIDMDAFYLDRENEIPLSGDECARDHDLVRRELNYGRVVSRFTPSDAPAALFGPDDTQHDAQLRGHEIAYTLRPGEKVVFRWDNIGKYAAESEKWAHLPKYFGNSKFVFTPRLDLKSVEADAESHADLVQVQPNDLGAKLAGESADAQLTYKLAAPYPACGGAVRARFVGRDEQDAFTVSMSLDGEKWTQVWKASGKGPHEADVKLDQPLDVHNHPPKFQYFVRVGLASSGDDKGAMLCSLEMETDVMAAPTSLPRLRVGANKVRYWDATEGEHRVRITHEWKESDAVQPLTAIAEPTYPRPGAEVRDSLIKFTWPKVEGADRYHFQVSRRADFAYPYRTSLDVVIPTAEWSVPFTGIFSPDTTYHWRLRCCDQWGVWGDWSDGWTFTWHGPRVPVNVRLEQEGQTFTLRWEPNPRGERPVKYEVYGSDEKGFSVNKDKHVSYTRGEVPGNLVGETTDTSMVVIAPDAKLPNTNCVYYRVVAVDANGTVSGCSDYAEAPHPFIYTAPVEQAKVGAKYACEVKSLRSLNDVQHHYEKPGNQFWDIEENTYRLVEGPAWLTIDPKTGVLSGTPPAAGTVQVKVEVTNQFEGKAEQAFELVVAG